MLRQPLCSSDASQALGRDHQRHWGFSIKRSTRTRLVLDCLATPWRRQVNTPDLCWGPDHQNCRQARDDARERADDITRVAREGAREQADAIRRLAVEERNWQPASRPRIASRKPKHCQTTCSREVEPLEQPGYDRTGPDSGFPDLP